MLLEFFDGQAGVCVDVGANHPFENSLSWPFEQRGWRCVLVEPHPRYAEMLRRERHSVVYECVCGDPWRAGTTTMLTLAGPLSTAAGALVDPTAQSRVEGQVEVPVMRLDQIFEREKITNIDFLSVDVEGMELQVLEGFDLKQVRPRLILLEDHVLNLSKHRYMKAHGYQLLRRTGVNAWYVPHENAVRLSWFATLQLFRKYYVGLPWRRMRHAVRAWRHRRAASPPPAR